MNRSGCALALTALLASASASAELITYDFTAINNGRFDRSSDPSLLLPAGFAAGSLATGFITFETSIADTNPDPSRGRYPGAVVDFQATIDGLLFDYDATLPSAYSQAAVLQSQSDIVAFSARDGFGVFSTPAGSGYSFVLGLQTNPSPFLGLQVPTGDAFFSDLSSISDWWLTWTVFNSAPTDNVASGSIATVTSLVQRPASVPEPGTTALLLTGLLGLAARRKRVI